MRHQRTLIWLALLAGPVLLRAQPPAFSLERRSCPAADSSLGTPSEAQSRGRISRFHSSGDDRTYIRTYQRGTSARGADVSREGNISRGCVLRQEKSRSIGWIWQRLRSRELPHR